MDGTPGAKLAQTQSPGVEILGGGVDRTRKAIRGEAHTGRGAGAKAGIKSGPPKSLSPSQAQYQPTDHQ